MASSQSVLDGRRGAIQILLFDNKVRILLIAARVHDFDFLFYDL